MSRSSRYLNGVLLFLLLAAAAALLLLQPAFQWQTPAAERWFYAAGALLAWLVVVVWQYKPETRSPRQFVNRSADQTDWLVAYASQTGMAEHLARQSAHHLQAAGQQVVLLSMQQLTPADLARYRRALLVVSTTGEGDAPDDAVDWPLNAPNDQHNLGELQFALLALGDRNYQQFGAFGRRLDDWLQDGGAQPLFARIDVDNCAQSALDLWQQQLQQLAQSSAELQLWQEPSYQRWTLTERYALHEEADAGLCFHLSLAPVDAAHLQWQAGDIARIRLPAADGDNQTEAVYREYSIASLPDDGHVQLLLRQRHFDTGQLGPASAYLTQQLKVGETLALSIRSNPRFHLPKGNRPLVLIGNGTGIAGLRALLKACIAQGFYQNWLIFGLRCHLPDGYFRQDIEQWRASGFLTKHDEVFSREGDKREYVQHRLYHVADELREWVANGAAIYVCGSRQGMASDVDAALADILGKPAMETLRQGGLYRRDVY